jgi:hypothetical protein
MSTHQLKPLAVTEDRTIRGVQVRREGHEVVVELRLSDESYLELGREFAGDAFSHYWSLEKFL